MLGDMVQYMYTRRVRFYINWFENGEGRGGALYEGNLWRDTEGKVSKKWS